MKILNVTQADINESRERRTASTLERQRSGYFNARDCPIGVALARQFETDRKHVNAHPDSLRVSSNDFNRLREHFKATQTIRNFMRDWDRFGRVKPHNFKLLDY